MSSSPPALPARQRRQNNSKPHDKVSFGSTENDEHEYVLLNQRERKTKHYRRDISTGHRPQTGGMDQKFDVRVQDNINRTEHSLDEYLYDTIKDNDYTDSNKSDDNYLHPEFQEPGDSRTNRRREHIKRWSIDKLEKNKRLSTIGSASPSMKSFSDEDSDNIFNTEEDNSQLTSRKHGASSRYDTVGIYHIILLVLAIASLTCIIVFGLLLIFKPQDSSILMELEKVQDQLKRQEKHIKDLSDRLEERNSIITHLVNEFAQLKEDFDYIIQNFQNISKGRPDS